MVTADSTTANPYESALTGPNSRPLNSVERCEVQLEKEGKPSLTVYFVSRPPVRMQIGITTAEDLRLDLGAPTRHFIREDDRLSIYSPTAIREDTAYFASHFDLGMDFLLDGSTHRLLKVVVHSNLPGEALFGRYARCSWTLTAASGQSVHCTNKASIHATVGP